MMIQIRENLMISLSAITGLRWETSDTYSGSHRPTGKKTDLVVMCGEKTFHLAEDDPNARRLWDFFRSRQPSGWRFESS